MQLRLVNVVEHDCRLVARNREVGQCYSGFNSACSHDEHPRSAGVDEVSTSLKYLVNTRVSCA